MHSEEDKIKAVLAWAETDSPESFDSSFVESLSEQYEERGSISPRQAMALDNIIDKFEIDIAQYL